MPRSSGWLCVPAVICYALLDLPGQLVVRGAAYFVLGPSDAGSSSSPLLRQSPPLCMWFLCHAASPLFCLEVVVLTHRVLGDFRITLASAAFKDNEYGYRVMRRTSLNMDFVEVAE